MSKITQIVYRWLDFDPKPSADLDVKTTNEQAIGLHGLRMLVGLIWLFDSWTASASANKHAVARFMDLPFGSCLVRIVGNGILLIDLFIAIALLSGKGMRAALWIGSFYLVVMWIGIAHTGGFNPAAGATDPGIAPPYLILLVLTFATWRISQPPKVEDPMTRNHALLWIHAMRLAFGFLWAWDAIFKWHPYYLSHLVDYLTAAQQGEPAWMVAYEQFWITVVTSLSPIAFAVLTALVETVLAWSLITGRMLRLLYPIGFVYSLVIWSTAERFGGPYTANGHTGMTGNMLGNAILYALVFLFFMLYERWPKRSQVRQQIGATETGVESADRRVDNGF